MLLNDLTRFRFISVLRDNALSVRYGKSPNPEQFSILHFQVLMDVVRFDVNNAFFTIGKHLLKQREGAPIGRILSSGLAISVCISLNTSG